VEILVIFKERTKMKTLDAQTKEKPEIIYPTSWGYKVIGRDKKALEACIKEIMKEKKYLCSLGNTSRTGKFHTYNASCTVESEEERYRIFGYFEKHADVNMVI